MKRALVALVAGTLVSGAAAWTASAEAVPKLEPASNAPAIARRPAAPAVIAKGPVAATAAD